MSEYIEIETETGDDGMILFHTNLPLTAKGREEIYESPEALDEGSPVAQALSVVTGIEALTMSGGELAVAAAADADWHAIVADITAALKDFFL